ncbi:hypothetical protein [Delftia tsuruhatensis]|nr:hypothetical protein [Delftia tsuruhatensis]
MPAPGRTMSRQKPGLARAASQPPFCSWCWTSRSASPSMPVSSTSAM